MEIDFKNKEEKKVNQDMIKVNFGLRKPKKRTTNLKAKDSKKMNKLYEALDLMQRMCDFNLDTDDLAGLNANVEAKKALIDTYNSARCTAQLDKMKEIIRKVENGETMWQGNGDVYEDK